jgi:hypothetical protein
MESRHSGLLPLVSALTPGNFDPMQVLSPAMLALRAANTLVGGPAPDVLRVPPPVESILVHGVHTIAPPGATAVTSITPTSDTAAGGTPVTLRGTGFTGATQVAFVAIIGGATANATDMRVYNDTTMRVTSPAGAGQVNVVVTSPAGVSTANSTNEFGYVPQVTGLNPTSGSSASNTLVRISGQGFTAASVVELSSQGPLSASQVSVASDSLIVAVIPPGTGTVDVQVTTAGMISRITPADQFTYVNQSATISPSSSTGPIAGGTLVTITGVGLTGATAVRFGPRHFGTQMNVVSDTEICVITPAGSGSTSVYVVMPSGDLWAGSFTYT